MAHAHRPNIILTLGDDITVIAITGGPCGGKTTALADLYGRLTDRGYKVLVSPESATKLITAGMLPGELSKPEFQEEILLDILAQEERMHSIATRYRDAGRKVVILCDRGTMDGEAYIEPEQFTGIIERLGYSRSELCDGRYHAAMHLQSAAIGAVEAYTLSNNRARTETVEQAEALDRRTLHAWQCHRHPRLIDNSTDFQGKLHRLFGEICAVLGDPVPLEREDKYVIRWFDPRTLPVRHTESLIRQDYLVSPSRGEERRVRSRTDASGTIYFYTMKRRAGPGVRIEQEKMIAQPEYDALLSMRDMKKRTIEKRRVCFFWDGQFFEADFFLSPHAGLTLLEAERTESGPRDVEIPPFIQVVGDVSDDARYSNAELARGTVLGLASV